MSDQANRETIATQRFQWVAPLLAEGLDAAQIRVRREEICAQTAARRAAFKSMPCPGVKLRSENRASRFTRSTARPSPSA